LKVEQLIMTITEAMRAANDEYNAGCEQCKTDLAFAALLADRVSQEYDEMDDELMSYVAGVGIASGLPNGTIVSVDLPVRADGLPLRHAPHNAN
jgi:hypothetical protein